MTDFAVTRRDVLGGGAALAGSAALAGCLDGLGGLGGGGGRPTPAGSTGPYTRWTYPAATVVEDATFSSISSVDVSTIRANADALSSTAIDFYTAQTEIEPRRIPWADLSAHHVINGAPAAQVGTVDPDAVVEELTGEGYEQVEPHGGYERLSGDEFEVAVRDGRLLSIRRVEQGPPPGESLAAAIDARAEAGPRLIEGDEDFATLGDWLGEGAFVFGVVTEPIAQDHPDTGLFPGVVAYGYRLSLAGEPATGRWVRVFRTADGADPKAVREWTTSSSVFDGFRNVSVDAVGRTVVVDGEIEKGSIETYY